ncbi:autotransporter domain-containing protein [Halomonas denitrificans]|nr:autotransporter domain-containing protein [Halomonas denitrificans]
MNDALAVERSHRGLRRLIALALCVLILLFAGEARANVLEITVFGDGVVTDANFGINCTRNGGTCQFDSGTGTITVFLTANPQPGQDFIGWGGECAPVGIDPDCTVVVDGDMGTPAIQSVTANFSSANASLSVNVTGGGTGSVQSDLPGISCPGDCSEIYPTGSAVTLFAEPGPTSVFTGWAGGGCFGTGDCTVNLAGDTAVRANFESDADGDGVIDAADACPNTPAGEPVDAAGCGPSQVDDDGDGVGNGVDQCPDTPPGAQVDANGCAPSQLDDDGDGVTNDRDQCPDTPPGTQVDADGCPASQQDDDGDGVANDVDQCPGTPAGEPVDANGCSASQLDDDGDGVSDSLDQCPNTPAGEAVDADGCSATQLDEDADGINDAIDQCPGTPAGAPVDATGCSETQRFDNDLSELPGLSDPQRELGARLDEICPMLVAEGDAGNLTPPQQDLREACSALKDRDTTDEQAANALDQALTSQLPALRDYTVELTRSQFRHVRNRLHERRNGGGRGASVSGLNIRVNDQIVPSAALQSAFDGLIGMGASEEEPFGDFGKLGVFLQGDIDLGERDGDAFENGYDFDSWNLLLGADYRFTDDVIAGGSVSYGKVGIDHDGDRGETDVDQWALSLYAGWQISERWFLDGLVSYGKSDFDLERNVSYTDLGGRFTSVHEADTDGDQLFVGLNTGYTWNRGGWRFGPVASVTYIDGSIDGYTEASLAGSEAWNFRVGDRDIESFRVSAGAQVDYVINTDFGVLIPGLRVSYVMETEDENENIALRLINNPFDEATLVSDPISIDVQARDDAFFDASFNLSAQFPMGFSGFFSYNFYSAYDDFSKDAFTIGIRWDKPF